ncbi:MAG: VIT domain-containing protein, partial [Actinomycetota bacterium]
MTVVIPQLPHNIELPGCTLVAGATEFPLTGVTVKGHVDGQGVVWIVTQTFSNPLTEPAEAVYKFPLPFNGAVNGMKMKIAERVIEAVIKERSAAQVEYKEAKALGHTAALVEQERAEIFTTHVGNIDPGESVSVEIAIHCSVAVDGDEATLRFPMMVKERYNPSDFDAHSITTTRVAGPIAVDTDVTITFAEPVRNLVCDTVPSANIAGQTVTITDSAAMKTDIVLRWDAASEVCTAKWTPDNTDSDEGTVEVTIRTEGAAMTVAKK